MPRYIDADALLDKQEELLKHVSPHSDIAKRTYQIMVMLQTAPTISPDEVRGEGKWIEKEVYDLENTTIEQMQSASCSVCGKIHTTPFSYYFDNFNYCPNCGARMKGVSEDA